MNSLNKTFNHILVEYGAYLSTEKGLSRNTVENYLRDIQKFLLAVQKNSVTDISTIDETIILNALKEMSKTVSKRTMGRYISSVRGFIKYLQNEKNLLENVTINLKNPKIQQSLPEVLSVQEVEKLLDAPEVKTKNGARDKAILEVLYATGMRVSELISLKFEQLFLKEGYIRVIGKGNKERIIPIGSVATDALLYYIERIRPTQKNAFQTSFVFLNNRGGPLSRQTVWRILQKYAKKSGLSDDLALYPHILRHSFASHLLAGGANLRLIQELLGHADIATTQIYTHLADEETLAMYNASHPRSQSNKNTASKKERLS